MPFLLYLIVYEILNSASERAKLCAELFSQNSYLDDSGHEILTFHQLDITLINMVIIPKMVKKAISNFDSSKACFPDCWKVMSVVLVFKNVGELSFSKLTFCV